MGAPPELWFGRLAVIITGGEAGGDSQVKEGRAPDRVYMGAGQASRGAVPVVRASRRYCEEVWILFYSNFFFLDFSLPLTGPYGRHVI